jgi:YidC/Oxa1 family membrane protein insertase
MDEQNRNLILASVLCLAVIIIWPFLVPPPAEAPQPAVATQETSTIAPAAAPVTAQQRIAPEELAEGRTDAPRIVIDTKELSGSISLQGGRIDDLALKSYQDFSRRRCQHRAAVPRHR